MLHCCVFGGLILSGMHLARLMGCLLLLVNFAFVLFSYIYLLGLHDFLVRGYCYLAL